MLFCAEPVIFLKISMIRVYVLDNMVLWCCVPMCCHGDCYVINMVRICSLCCNLMVGPGEEPLYGTRAQGLHTCLPTKKEEME